MNSFCDSYSQGSYILDKRLLCDRIEFIILDAWRFERESVVYSFVKGGVEDFVYFGSVSLARLVIPSNSKKIGCKRSADLKLLTVCHVVAYSEPLCACGRYFSHSAHFASSLFGNRSAIVWNSNLEKYASTLSVPLLSDASRVP